MGLFNFFSVKETENQQDEKQEVQKPDNDFIAWVDETEKPSHNVNEIIQTGYPF